MLNELKANFYFLYKDSGRSILYFWSIYIGFITAFLIITSITDNVTLMLSMALPAAIYTLIFGILFVKESFPYMIKYGSTRQGYFIAIAIFSAVFSLIMVTVNQIVSFLMNKIINYFQLTNVELQVFDDMFKEQYSTFTNRNI